MNPVPDRIWAKIAMVPECGCWLWEGCVDSSGYGSCRDESGARVRPHRLIYARLVGPIADGLVLRHKCDTRRCCNPCHLIPGTHEENMAEMVERGRSFHPVGPKNHRHRYHWGVRLWIRFLTRLHSDGKVARMTGISRASVRRFRMGETS